MVGVLIMSQSTELNQTRTSRQYATLTFMRAAIVALSIALIAGLLSAAYYIPYLAPYMQKVGINFAALRPIHTTFASAFIFMAGIAVIHRYLEDVAEPMRSPERFRLRLQVILWAFAACAILSSLLLGVFSGREYLGFHPFISLPIILGWLLCCWNFFSHVRKGIFCRPIHVSMWSIGLIFFVYTFAEQHAWLMPGVFSDPVVDLRIQWKATGTLVGSMNLLVYGTLYYLATKISGDDNYAHSRLAYALFAVGLLNSFTNFAHHTYHIPQSHTVKWISFVISMTEVILLARVVWDITAMVKERKQSVPCSVQLFVRSTKWWTAYILASSLLISIPPLNALFHGTPVVMGHAMGAMIGIDAMVLFAAISWILVENRSEEDQEEDCRVQSVRFRFIAVGFNISVAMMIAWLTVSGAIMAVYRYEGLASPDWLAVSSPFILFGTGLLSVAFLGKLLDNWLHLLFKKN